MSRKRIRRNKIKVYTFIIIVSIFLCVIYLFIIQIEKRFFPAIIAVSETTMQTKLNNSIYDSAQKAIAELDLVATDFYHKNPDGFSVNSILVNDICGKIAVEVSNTLSQAQPEKITLPIGSIFGIESLSNIGPNFSIVVLSMGNATVDYETSFKSVGINQVNFQIWLNVESNVKIVNPLQQSSISVKRKISLLNTVIKGEIPNMYFQGVGQ